MDLNPIDNIRTVTKIKEKDSVRLNTRTSDKDKTYESESIISKQNEVASREITESQVKKVVAEANQRLTLANTKYKLNFNSEKGRFTVKVFNKETNEEVGEIPSKNMEKILDNIWEVTGLIIDKKV